MTKQACLARPSAFTTNRAVELHSLQRIPPKIDDLMLFFQTQCKISLANIVLGTFGLGLDNYIYVR